MNTKKSLIHQTIRSFFKLFFRLLYHEFAWTYDWVAAIVSVGRWKSWTYCVLPYLSNGKVLELGPGPGHLQVDITQRGILSFGLDASWQMARQASKRLQKNSVPGKICLGRSQALPYASEEFDQVVATFPSEYIIDPQTLAQTWRVLKVGGELIVLPLAWITGKKWWDRLAAGLFRITGQTPNIDPESGAIEEFIPEEFIKKFGFNISNEIIQLPSSKVLLIRATKIIPGRNQEELG